MDVLLKLKSALDGVQFEVGNSQINTIENLLYDGKITTDQAIEIANNNAFIQEGQVETQLDIQEGITAKTTVTKVTNTTRSYDGKLQVIDLERFADLAKDDLGHYNPDKGYQLSGGTFTKNTDEAIFDKALQKALADDIRTVQYRVKQIEKYKWLKAQVYIPNRDKPSFLKGIEDVFPKLFDLSLIHI